MCVTELSEVMAQSQYYQETEKNLSVKPTITVTVSDLCRLGYYFFLTNCIIQLNPFHEALFYIICAEICLSLVCVWNLI